MVFALVKAEPSLAEKGEGGAFTQAEKGAYRWSRKAWLQSR